MQNALPNPLRHGEVLRQATPYVERREEGPKERVGAMVAILVVFGFGAGSFAQPVWDKSAECKALGKPIMACLFLPQ